jgi:type VI secretion system protein ImpG
MSDELLPYYNRELAFLRHLGAEFAEAHPKIAGRLRWGPDAVRDPHVARLIEAFAFLSARIRHKLDDEFPEVSESLLGVLYPHYLAPIPSLAIVQFALDPQQGQLTSGYSVPRGETVETEPIEGQPCRFRTCYPVTLWPLELKAAELRGQPFAAPPVRLASPARAVVRLALQTSSDKLAVKQLPLGSLRFYLQGQTPFVYDLYELLLNNTLGVAVASGVNDPAPVLLGSDAIRPVGFGRDEGLLDYPPRSFWGYRLLSEYFAFPEKFLFLELSGLTPQVLEKLGRTLELYLYLGAHSRDLEKQVTRETFQLGCSPIVNLFPQRAEPISLTETETEYRVVPDARRPLAHEVYAVQRVIATSPENEEVEFLPFFSVKHGSPGQEPRTFWHAARRPAQFAGGQVDAGTELWLSLVDLDFQPSAPAKWTLDVETICLNRDLPRRLPFGGGQPHLQLVSASSVAKVVCLTAPTPTLRPALRHGTVWRLISHLSLNHLSLADTAEGAEALREILRLYDFADSAGTRAAIEGVRNVRSRRVVGRVGGHVSGGFCRGLEVTLQLDEEKFTGGGVFLFASVLERFLGLYTSLNSFTKTVVTTQQREEPLRRWPPRAGEQVLL